VWDRLASEIGYEMRLIQDIRVALDVIHQLGNLLFRQQVEREVARGSLRPVWANVLGSHSKAVLSKQDSTFGRGHIKLIGVYQVLPIQHNR
jgi:hypothetical protein